MFTKDKILKYTTESSSVNGYYMIPVYNKGEYLLKVEPPPGWSFGKNENSLLILPNFNFFSLNIDPTEIPLNIDGINDPCSKNEDLNFYFKGFGLSGKVITYGDINKKGPANVKLDLLLNEQKISSATSALDGSYYFSNIMPGDYKIQASHPTWKFKVNTVSVTLSKDNWSAKEYIIVSGYTIEGFVLSGGDKKPIKNAIVTLKFSTANLANLDTSKFECEHSETPVLDANEICHVKTDDKGKFQFQNIGFQKYVLQAVYKIAEDSVVIFTKPSTLNADLIKHDDLILNEKFELSYLNLKAKALITDYKNDKKEIPVANALIVVNDKETGLKTDNQGDFQLDNLLNGVDYKVTLKSNHVGFEEKSIKIDLAQKSFTEFSNELKNFVKFFVKSFDVCGKIKFKQEIKNGDLLRFSKIIRLKVFQYNSKNEEINTKIVNIDENLSYCFKLLQSESEYVVKIDTAKAVGDANADLEGFLKFNVDEHRIVINREPVLDLNFEQFDAELNGVVQFLSSDNVFKCPTNFKIHLKSKNKIEFVKEITDLICNLDKKQFEFQIRNVLFGQYYLVSNYDQMFCWNLIDDSTKTIQEGDRLGLNINNDKEFVQLKQVAYKLAYKFHDMNVNFKILDEKNELISQKIISSQSGLSGLLCINKLDQQLFIEFESCHLLNPVVNVDHISELSLNRYKIDLKNLSPNLIEFQSSQHTLKIEVNTKLDKNLKEEDLTNEYKEIEISVYEITGPTSASEEEITKDREPTMKILLNRPQFQSGEAEKQLQFTSTSWLSGDKTYLFKPISRKYLFKPSFAKFKLDSINCNSNLINFNARLGLFIKGRVSPSHVEGFEVTLKSFDNSTVYTSEMTDAKTGFYLGPFENENSDDDFFLKYRIELSKPNYLFKLLSKNLFNGEYLLDYSVERLGELSILVLDEVNEGTLENVLVSLSSSNKLYRKILKTNSTGFAVFDNLEADIYYVLVMMQEYEFVPNSKVVNITSGFVFTIGVAAKRVAYSCYGKMSTINGLPVGDIIVEANGIDDGNDNLNCKQSQENTKSDNDTGIYRIRGLKPKCKYDIIVKQAVSSDTNSYLYKIIPQVHNIEISSNDVFDLNFLLIDNLITTSEISLRTNVISSKSLDGNADSIQKTYKNNIRLKLFKLNQPDSVIQTFIIPSNSIFYLSRLPRDNQQFILQAELLTPTALVSAMSAQQQQQQQQQQVTVLDRDEIIFQADKLFKQLVFNFDLSVKKHSSFSSSSGAYFDANGQQYQTIYFTLPLFLMILTIIYFKFKDLNELIKTLRQKLENSGYLGSVVSVKSNTQKQSQQQQQQPQKISKQTQQQAHTSDKSSNELDSSSTSSIDVIDNEGNSISPKKVRVRKT